MALIVQIFGDFFYKVPMTTKFEGGGLSGRTTKEIPFFEASLRSYKGPFSGGSKA